jgi:hypothetical protein
MNEFKDSGIHLLIWRRSSSIHLLICGRRRTRPQQQSSSRAAAEQQQSSNHTSYPHTLIYLRTKKQATRVHKEEDGIRTPHRIYTAHLSTQHTLEVETRIPQHTAAAASDKRPKYTHTRYLI